MNTRDLNALSRKVTGAAIAVHRELGPGLEEEDYETALSAELTAMGIGHECQAPLPVVYKGVRLDAGYRLDVFVEWALILEVKSVETVHPIHEAQLMTYVRLSKRKLGLLLNFDVPVLKQGIRRRVMGLEEDGVNVVAEPDGSPEPFAADPRVDKLSNQVLSAAIEVHQHLGPGLLKSAYKECVCYELSARKLDFERRKPVDVRFRDVDLPKPVEMDVVVAGNLPLVIVSVKGISPLLEARLTGWLQHGRWSHGLLLNFGEKRLADGIRRLVNPLVRNN